MSSKTIYTSRCSCIICHREFSIKSFHTHFQRIHLHSQSNYKGNAHKANLAYQKNASHRRELLITQYYYNPKKCTNCQCELSFDKRLNKFCSSSCAATYNNARKDWSNITTGPSPKPKLPKIPRKKRSSELVNAEGPYTRIYLSTCKITGKQWYSETPKTIHPSAAITKKLYSYQCRFVFSIADYPQLFSEASELIKQYGWYSASNRGNNLSGCSRDHLYSVSDGFKNNVDPKILSHPMNCKVVPHRKNQNKHKNSSITLSALLDRIALFDEMESVTRIELV